MYILHCMNKFNKENIISSQLKLAERSFNKLHNMHHLPPTKLFLSIKDHNFCDNKYMIVCIYVYKEF